MNRLRRNLTYSNVISTLCLVLLVGGGTAYAATEVLPKDSVGSKQIREEAVTPAKLSEEAKEALGGTAVVRTEHSKTPANELTELKVECEPGEVATGGGVKQAEGPIGSLTYFEPGGIPVFDLGGKQRKPTGWEALAWNGSGNSQISATIFVVCVSP
jgi:hypothetical protein